jgi:hypothetical protein
VRGNCPSIYSAAPNTSAEAFPERHMESWRATQSSVKSARTVLSDAPPSPPTGTCYKISTKLLLHQFRRKGLVYPALGQVDSSSSRTHAPHSSGRVKGKTLVQFGRLKGEKISQVGGFQV